MADDNHQAHPEEEMRQCPTCRMKVSIWATKCHYCGEEVGRPRKEELKLTLKDLGGGQATTYAPSGNVRGALESFREEEASHAEAEAARRRKVGLLDRLFGKTPPPVEKPLLPSLAELDEYSRNLSASLLEDIPASSSISISRSQLPQPRGSDVRQKLTLLGVVLVALLVLYFGGNFAWARISEYLESKNKVDTFVYTNMARDMLARGEEPIVAYEEAMTALGHNDTEENRAIAEEVRRIVLKQVDDLMKENPWRRESQDEAYNMVQRALHAGSHPSVLAKFEEVSRDVGQFKFVLKSVDDEKKTATFRLNNPNYDPEVTVEVADRLMDRFIVAGISSSGVDLNDDRVRGRKLTIALNQGVRSKY